MLKIADGSLVEVETQGTDVVMRTLPPKGTGVRVELSLGEVSALIAMLSTARDDAKHRKYGR